MRWIKVLQVTLKARSTQRAGSDGSFPVPGLGMQHEQTDKDPGQRGIDKFHNLTRLQLIDSENAPRERVYQLKRKS